MCSKNRRLFPLGWWHQHCSKEPGALPMENELENLRLLTLPEAAELLQVSRRTLHRMIRKNDLPAFKVGGQWRLRESQLTHWIQRREDPSADIANDHKAR
jgi:excisionase family DNA binding protein